MAKSVARTWSVVGAAALLLAIAGSARADWWSENFQLSGKAYSQVYFNSPSLSQDFQMSQWWNAVEMNFDVRLYEADQFGLSFHTIVTPTYDAVYDIYPDYFGDRRKGAQDRTVADVLGGVNPTQSPALARLAINGETFPGHGACIRGGFCDVNQDTAFLFTGKNNPQMVFDNTIFFGILGAATRSRGPDQGKVGGASQLKDWTHAANFWRDEVGLTPATFAFLDTMEQGRASDPTGERVIRSFGSSQAAHITGSRASLENQFPVGLNHTDGQLQTRCFDGVHDWCWMREAYFDVRFGDTQLRAGRQQIVWGKTDAFRLQDVINPIDYGYHNVFPSLEDRRIPVLALDLVHSFGNVGPLQDVSLELVWVVDKFKPTQVGQCGDFWAFTAACESRADTSGHALLNQSLARVETRDWQLQNTEPGFRFEFRIPEPSIAFSISGFWGFQDEPVARGLNGYSTTNPNPAMMMFLQAQGINPNLIPGFDFLPAFNPFDAASVQASSDATLGAWTAAFGAGGAICDDTALGDRAHANCISASGLQPVGWVWSASQFQAEYPRVFTLGGSLDYQIPNVDTVLRLETAYEFNRKYINTNIEDTFDYVDSSDVVRAAIGLDRSFFIPWLNKDRTAFVSFQTFMEHVLDYEGNQRRGFVAHEWGVISTFFIENYWRQDSLVLTTFFAYDWAAQAWITGPKFKWVVNDQVSFEIGVNLLQGSRKDHNIRDICSDGGLGCLGDPTTWQNGNWQLINAGFDRYAEAPWWGLESFADTMMEERDEVWVGVTYQF
jgi:hypothetical protein